jgi:hypothetical protein
MLDTQLILIEGLGGSGKTTTARYLEEVLRREGPSIAAILEGDMCHPKFEFPKFVAHYTTRMLEEWSLFLAQRERRREVCLMEGHGWQPMAEFMYLAGYPRQTVINFCDDIASIISPLNPVVVYYAHEDIAQHLERVEQLRGRQWVAFMEDRDTMHHGLKEFGGSLLRFWSEWALLQDEIFSRCSFPKLGIGNPHDNWDATYTRILSFLQVA